MLEVEGGALAGARIPVADGVDDGPVIAGIGLDGLVLLAREGGWTVSVEDRRAAGAPQLGQRLTAGLHLLARVPDPSGQLGHDADRLARAV